ncbi:phage integrase SAM-like domain-containing protein [Heyndrickxia sporothermodurans]|uniref:phage integrase SAM-like domain-containing protein n=1 Tax=Heyndrickxia sporothermodurans TaxID=46224 RepID=UPI00192C4EB4|nr:phage integrase SAM-like domain-containing protein [Heyndrickxia sporothermodurans]MBL5797767.1 phage integrase SAM-like domain-containing protein [Heyndrickxia sporothermodurans]MBL5833064.1 phage integrase SAM-like domain-containing protein [Heyndrickxia sporothermodurans]
MLIKFPIQDFLDDKEFKNLSSTTIQACKNILGQFQQYCSENEILNVQDITTNICKKYLLHCQRLVNNPAGGYVVATGSFTRAALLFIIIL